MAAFLASGGVKEKGFKAQRAEKRKAKEEEEEEKPAPYRWTHPPWGDGNCT